MERTHTVIQMPPTLLTVLEEWVRKQTDVTAESPRLFPHPPAPPMLVLTRNASDIRTLTWGDLDQALGQELLRTTDPAHWPNGVETK